MLLFDNIMISRFWDKGAGFSPNDLGFDVIIDPDNFVPGTFVDSSGNENDFTVIDGTAVKNTGGQNNQPYITCTGLYAEGTKLIDTKPLWGYAVVKMAAAQTNFLLSAKDDPTNYLTWGFGNTLNQLGMNIGNGVSQVGHFRILTVSADNVFALLQFEVDRGHAAVYIDNKHDDNVSNTVTQPTLNSNLVQMTPALGRDIAGRELDCDMYWFGLKNGGVSPVDSNLLMTWFNDRFGGGSWGGAELWTGTAVDLLTIEESQSNNKGSGTVNVNLSAVYQGPQANVSIFSGTTFSALEEGVNNKGDEYGPEMSYGYTYNINHGRPVLMVKNAVSSTRLYEDGTTATWNYLYTQAANSGTQMSIHMFEYFKALFVAREDGLFPTHRRISIAIGENDATNSTQSVVFEANLNQVIDGVMNSYGLNANTVRVVLYLIHTDLPIGTYPEKATVRTALTDVADARSNVVLIDCDDLTTSDNIHLDGAGYETKGIRDATL